MEIPSMRMFCLLLSLAVAFAASPALAADAKLGPDAATYAKAVDRGVEYLRKNQAEDGSFAAYSGPGITALVATGLLRNGRTPQDPTVAKALAYLETFVRDDGGIHALESTHKNYETALAVLCFTEANRNGRYDKTIKRADAFLKGIQWDESEDQDQASTNYGGAGYGRHKRPDLSNTSFLIDALRAAGNGPDDPAVQKALIFVSRAQNLETEHNTTPFAAKNPDGGFYYTPAAGGSSQAGETPEGGLRSYGSMTYAGLKSMLYAGVSADDPRVKAAFKWIQRFYTVKENPGMADNGLYYYYHLFAKALDAMEVGLVEDGSGAKHDWRRELAEELARRQRSDGSWANDNERWLEGDASLATGYALLTLAYCKPVVE
ncbi:MAG: terpene cyclase/mutase family protein [Planctomycetales bacterium]|nr:terpene cyclase/mutase family protein [Planctomycetales bacterium]